MDPSKRRGSAKKGVTSDDTKKRRAEKATKNTRRRREIMVRSRREACPEADKLYDLYEEAKKNNTVEAWRAELIQAYQGCKISRLNTCEPDEVGDLMDLMDILGELKLEEENKIELGGGKMVGGNNPIGNNPIEQLLKLNSWLATHQEWSTCAKWFLTQIWEKCCKLYGYLYDGIGDAIGIIKDVGLTALGDTNTETFKFTAAAFSDLYSAGSEAVNTAALKTYPYFRAIEEDVQKILVENKTKVKKQFPDVVTPQHFQEWLDNTSLVKKIYWTLVTLQSYQAGPLLAATVTTTSSIIMSASYYGVLMAYYITSSYYFTFVLLTSAAGTSVYNKLNPENQQRLKDLFDNFDKFMADKVLGPEVSPLTSMMDEIKKLPEEAKLFALKKAKLQNELTKSILTNAETKEELGKILQTKEMKAKIADVENATKQIQAQIESLEEEKEDERIEQDLEGMATTTDGGKRRTRKRGKRHSKRAPRKTKTLRKKRRGKK
jgi:hypothetical protein